MANPTILSGPSKDDIERTCVGTKKGKQLDTPTECISQKLDCRQNRSFGLSCVRQALTKQGLSSDTIEILMAAWRKSTQSKYDIYLKQWVNFCEENKLDILNASIIDGLNFLTHLFHKGNGYSSLKSARAALSGLLFDANGIPFGQQPLVSRFLKGVFNNRPSLPKYSYVWDVKILFDYFRKMPQNEELNLKNLTFKVASIIALLFHQRAQTLHVLDYDYMKIEQNAINFAFPKLLKNSRPGHHLKPKRLVKFPEMKLCPVAMISEYIARTKPLRGNETQFFISLQKPYHGVSEKTISRWLKDTLDLAGIDTSVFQGHSFRSTGSSTAKAKGVPIVVILQAAGWSSEKTFAIFYDKPICDKEALAQHSLLTI